MYKRMLVPLDGSELAEVVFTYAKELAARIGLEVFLFHVFNPEEVALAPLHRTYVEHKAEIIKRESQEFQEKKGIAPRSKPVEVRGAAVTGYPAEEILRYSDENDIDFILMANLGRSGVRRWAIGSVAEKVLRTSNIPVLLVRAGIPEDVVYDKWPRRTILVPLDGSELAEAVLPHVEALAKQGGTELADVVLLRVCGHTEMDNAKFVALTEEYLAKVEKRLKNASLNVKSSVIKGEPAEQIVEYANLNPVNLIVMSTHARSGLDLLALGSVAAKVLQKASSPIFLVRPRQA